MKKFVSVALFLFGMFAVQCFGSQSCSDKYGTQKFPGESCSNILERRCAENAEDGVYWMRLDTGERSFPVFCDMKAGAWTLIFKAIAGVTGRVAGYWKLPITSFEYSLAALNKNNYFKHHYTNRIIKEWSTFQPKEARVVVYKERKETMVLRFDVEKSDNMNWFSATNLREAPWLDILTETKNHFVVEGPCWDGKCRDFHINNVYNSCPNDVGWLSVGDSRTCNWERQHPEDYILYSHGPSKTNYNNQANVSSGDVFAVYVR